MLIAVSVWFVVPKNICLEPTTSIVQPGLGVHPETDHKGMPFKDPKRARRAGARIAGKYVGILDGFEGDQDFMRLAFHLTSRLLNCSWNHIGFTPRDFLAI